LSRGFSLSIRGFSTLNIGVLFFIATAALQDPISFGFWNFNLHLR